MRFIHPVFVACSLFFCDVIIAEQVCLEDTDTNDRYIDHQDGTITDTTTGLRWTLCVAGQSFIDGMCQGEPEKQHFNTALKSAQTLTIAEIEHWRVPNITELRSLLNLDCANPALSLIPFQAGQSNISHLSKEYSTSSYHEHWGSLAYRTVDFSTGAQTYSTTEVDSTDENETNYVRYVTDALN